MDSEVLWAGRMPHPVGQQRTLEGSALQGLPRLKEIRGMDANNLNGSRRGAESALEDIQGLIATAEQLLC